ncbi:YrhK family protein [Thalassospira sp. MA62]|nr:YrhK family protein [Thalassospira sp. MA62]
MKLFQTRRFDASPAHRKVYSAYELAYSVIDLLAAVLFIVGSFLFLDEDTTYAGTWLFIIGSIFFAARPAVRLARELHLAGLSEDNEDDGNQTDRHPTENNPRSGGMNMPEHSTSQRQ